MAEQRNNGGQVIKLRKHRTALISAGVATAALVALVGGAALSPGLSASFSAAFKAFRDPSLISKAEQALPAGQAAPVNAGETCTKKSDLDVMLDARIAGDFEKPSDEDLEDPEGGTLKTLVLPDLRVPVTRRTMRFVRFFARTQTGRQTFLQRFRRGGAYRSHIEQALREAGLPEDLVWLPAIESGFDPTAVSPVGAAGLWQFMPQTGALYGLHQSQWVDERKSIVRSTSAAASHLRDLYERFGRWDLALAAYNLGFDGVLGAMERAIATRPPQDQGKPVEFSDLAEAGLIPEETANYVPQLMAFAIVAANRTRFGLDSPELSPVPPLEFGELAFPEGTRLRTIARAAGIPTSLLREYNPELLKDRLPTTGGDYLVRLPPERVQRTLAAFPAYLDNEVLGADDPGAPEPAAAVDLSAGDLNRGEGLPRRPTQLGHNRLPSFSVPGTGPQLFGGETASMPFVGTTKLPMVFVGSGFGWQRPYGGDPFNVADAQNPALAGAKSRENQTSKQLGMLGGDRNAGGLKNALPPDPFEHFSMASGIAIHLRRDSSAPRVAITARIAGTENPVPMADDEGDLSGRVDLMLGSGEMRHTITVLPRDTETGLEIAAGRLRLLLSEAQDAHVAEQRRLVTAPRRQALMDTPYGQAYVTLCDALFPKGSPLEGTIVGAWEDTALARDLLLTESLRQERSIRRASLTIVGDTTRPQVEKVLEPLVGALSVPMLGEAPLAPHPREERLVVEDGVPSARSLYGWLIPRESDASEAVMRVLMEILVGTKKPRMDRVLKEDQALASLVKGALDLGVRASVATIEIAPAVPHTLSENEARMDAELAALAQEGPTREELGLAKALIKLRLQKEISSGTGPITPNAPRNAVSARIRRLLNPGSAERQLELIDNVNAAAIKSAAKRFLSKGNRVVVTTIPREGAKANGGAENEKP